MKIFVSYSRHDLDTVSQLVADLEAGQHEVWRDEKLAGGQTWWDQIIDQIRAADLFVFALSRHSLASGPCASEYEYAYSLGLRVLPVRLDARTSIQELPPELSELHWEQFEPGDKMSSLRILGAIGTLPPARPLPSPLPDPPEIPVSYLNHLRDKVRDPDPISVADQEEIITDLETRFSTQDDPIAIENILMALARRPELAKPVQRRVRSLRRRVDGAQPRPVRTKRDIRGVVTVVGGMITVVAIAAVVVLALRDDSPTSVAEAQAAGATITTPLPTTSTTTTTPPPTTSTTTTTPPPTTSDIATTSTTTAPPQPSGEIVIDEAETLDLAALAEYVTQLNFSTDVGCAQSVFDFASFWELPWQYFGVELWYWNPVLGQWLREDGLVFVPATGAYGSFCTNRTWDAFNGMWV